MAIDSIEDMRVLFRGIPLDQVSTSMTINAPGSLLLLLYQLVAEEPAYPATALKGTIQNDILKEYIARGTYIFPPKPSLRLVADTFAYCRAEIPKWNTISISGYHMAEAGASPAQEVAFTLANGVDYVRAALAAGLEVDDFAPRLSFFFVARTTLLEEVAKFRAARRIWARLMREEFGARNPRSMMLRFHTQTAGVQLTAQQPEVNLVRVAIQALGAVLGGTQSLHTNAYDEAIALPTEKTARLALRTQQVLQYETDLCATVDPFAGSYAVEAMTDEIEAQVVELMDRVAEYGSAVDAIEAGFQKREIEANAYRIAQEIESGERVVVGVNRFTEDGRGAVRAAAGRPGDRGGAGGAPRAAAGQPRRCRGQAHPGRPAGRRRGQRQRPLPDAGGAARSGHDRRGVRRPARRVGRLPPVRRVLTWPKVLSCGPQSPYDKNLLRYLDIWCGWRRLDRRQPHRCRSLQRGPSRQEVGRWPRRVMTSSAQGTDASAPGEGPAAAGERRPTGTTLRPVIGMGLGCRGLTTCQEIGK